MRQAIRKDFGSSFFVAVVPTLKDNFSYLIHDNASGTVAAVDANADIEPLLAYTQQHKLAPICTILSTHKHWDHAGGNATLEKAVREAAAARGEDVRTFTIIGGKNDNIPCVTQTVSQGDTMMLGSLKVEVLDVPCHTRGHVAYRVSSAANQQDGAALFTGDTMFLGGLGAFFEGDAKDMCAAMGKIYHLNRENEYKLDDRTFIFPGHEYTAGFMSFALKATPASETANIDFIRAQQKKYADQVAQGLPSVPSSLADEKKQNLFLRVCEEPFRALMGKGDEIQLMEYLYNACD